MACFGVRVCESVSVCVKIFIVTTYVWSLATTCVYCVLLCCMQYATLANLVIHLKSVAVSSTLYVCKVHFVSYVYLFLNNSTKC